MTTLDLERVDPDAARAVVRAYRRCACGRYLYPYRGRHRYAAGVCAECAGTRSPWREGATLVEDAAFLADTGATLDGAALQLATTPGALERALYRHGRGDIVRRMRMPR